MMMNNRTFLCVIATLIVVFVIFNVYKMQKKSSEKFSEM